MSTIRVWGALISMDRGTDKHGGTGFNFHEARTVQHLLREALSSPAAEITPRAAG